MTRCRLLPLLACTTLAGTAPLAGAQSSPYYLGASQTFTRDSNLLRLGDNQQAPAGFTKSDTISSTALLAGLDQPIGRQRVYGDVTLRANRLSNNKVYDNQGYALTGGLDWETVNDLSGSLKATANRNLATINSVEIGLLTKKNLETTQQLDGAVRLGVVTAWTAEFTFGLRSVDYTAIEYQSREFRQNNVSLGTYYKPSSASKLGVAVSDAKGRYPRFRLLGDGSFEADRYDRRTLDFNAYLAPSPISTFNARVSLGRTRYDVATQRDFSGVTGHAAWNWQPTGKLHFTTALDRDPGQDSYFLASQISDATIDYSRLTTTLTLRGDYAATAKVALNASAATSHRSLTRTLPLPDGSFSALTGSERYTNLALGGTWAPTRSVSVGCNLARIQRSGDAPLSSDMHDNSVSCFGQFTLQ